MYAYAYHILIGKGLGIVCLGGVTKKLNHVVVYGVLTKVLYI